MLDQPRQDRAMDARKNLTRFAADRGESLSTLSLKICRSDTYLREFVSGGTPRRLPEMERRHLAIVLNVDERLLGARDPWAPPLTQDLPCAR
jgi:hypothetical protein